MNHFFKLLIIFIFVFPTDAFSEITFNANGKWETTFDYSTACAQRGYGDEPNCRDVENDGIIWTWGGGIGPGDTYTRATADANYPGGGGLGARFWVYDGRNINSGSVRVAFPGPQKELWVRWYMRYQEGFRWFYNDVEGNIGFNKTFILSTYTFYNTDIVPGVHNNYSFRVQGDPRGVFNFTGGGWDETYGPGTSDGNWYCFEVYVKMNSTVGSSDGIMRWWVDGVLKAERTDIRYDNNDVNGHKGWEKFSFNSNQNYVANAGGPIGVDYAYVDYDDMVIYNQTPPNIDAHGNHFIGPISSMAPPRGLIINVQ